MIACGISEQISNELKNTTHRGRKVDVNGGKKGGTQRCERGRWQDRVDLEVKRDQEEWKVHEEKIKSNANFQRTLP